MLSASLSILLLSGLVAHSVVFHIVVANLLLNNSALMMLIPYVGMDVDSTLDVERLDVHSLVVRSGCSGRRCP